MSQAGLIDVEKSNPQIPTSFTTNSGTAIPISNNLEILGDNVSIQTTGAGKTVTISFIGTAFFKSIVVDTSTAPGTDPVLPSVAGQLTLTGAQVSSGTIGANVVRSISLLPNSITMQIQQAGSGAFANSALNGVSNYNSSDFTVDGVGFVSLKNGAGANKFQPDSGTNPVVPDVNGLVKTFGSGSLTTVGSLNTLTFQLTGLTSHAVLVGAGTSTITKVGPTATAGQVLQSAGAAADPAFSTATYPLTTTVSQILYSSSANTVTGLATANDGLLVTSNTGVPSILAGPGTTGQILQANAAAAPSFSTASYPSTTTINQLLYSSSNNVVAGLATANQAVLTTGATGIPVLTALATNGQLIIGSTAGVPAAATLTAGTGISITNGANSITIATSGAGFTWNDTSGTFTAVKENGYFLTAASTATLPASPSQGDAIDFVCDTTGSCVITANTGQFIRIANQLSSSAGTATNTARGDTLSLVYRSSTTTWFAENAPNGGWTTA